MADKFGIFGNYISKKQMYSASNIAEVEKDAFTSRKEAHDYMKKHGFSTDEFHILKFGKRPAPKRQRSRR